MSDVKRNKVLDALDAQDAMVGRVEEMDDAAKKEAYNAARLKYGALIRGLMEPLSEELYRAISAGKRSIDIGVWYQPRKASYNRLIPPTFTSPDGKKSCLVPLFRQAAEEWMMDVFCEALERELEVFEKRIVLVRTNILVRRMLSPSNGPRSELFAFTWNIVKKQ